ncbi:Lnb N-terminal periplasmic domain-containing protein [Autumnicola musiva]|uniref:DUF4105 domain-containing protein n=1 Tax=Autumnicola musiva TaxID=3075589 RepID=A0ABU3D5M3_9FLAO|nr:DUF4105 domain-containing protein [Zunongwangia sp. F117]MDT0676684.1 DUF4105 domain-containing protein [Zunongwangia sp. F117]
MKIILVFIFSLSQLGYSQCLPEISILTCSPGDKVYSVFGHSAIRITNKERSIDYVYNFGMFDFDTPNFTLKFVKGKLSYYLGIQNTANFIQLYTNENRLVLEQKLNLTKEEKSKIITNLNYLYQPENRYYLYSFLEKNCSTEIRDLLSEAGTNFSNQEIEESNRELINSHLKRNLWLRFGTNLMLGKSLDKKSDNYQRMFLPFYLKEEIANSYINGKPLVKSEQVLNSIENNKKNDLVNWFSPLLIFSLLLLIFLLWSPKPVELIICLLTGGIGLVLSLMWLFSEHPEVKNNLNVIWCNPLYLIYIPLVIKNRSHIILASALFITLISTIFIWIFNVQSFDIAVIPILIILGIINFKQLNRIGFSNLHKLPYKMIINFLIPSPSS